MHRFILVCLLSIGIVSCEENISKRSGAGSSPIPSPSGGITLDKDHWIVDAEGDIATLEFNIPKAKETYITDQAGCSKGGVWEKYTTPKVISVKDQETEQADKYAKFKFEDDTVSKCIRITINKEILVPEELLGVTSLKLGLTHACALLDDNTVKCWGYNGYGQLGDDSNITKLKAVTVKDLSDVKELAVGSNHVCTLTNNNKVKCWGHNGYGQVGDGTDDPVKKTSVEVTSLTNVHSIYAGANHTCVLLDSTTVKCWGNNNSGQLGNSSSVNSNVPVDVTGLTNVKQLALGDSHSCAILNDNSVKCWGNNSNGQLGDNSIAHKDVPTTISGITGVKSLSLGYKHTCAILDATGTVKCWGLNQNGQLGDNTTAEKLVPTDIAGLTQIEMISAGESHTCALLDDNTAKCWGDNRYGQVGDGNTEEKHIPTAVIELTGVAAVEASSGFSCALLADSSIKCWGNNSYGQLGNGKIPYESIPTAAPALKPVQAISLGGAHTCVIADDNKVKCLGSNQYGQLGDGTTSTRSELVTVNGLGAATQVSVGKDHTCAVLADKTLSCWGYNVDGQLGINSTTAMFELPQAVTSLTGVEQVETSPMHTCARLSSGAVRCWGYNGFGQLGNNTTTDSKQPVNVSGITNAKYITVGGNHSCAVLADGKIKCWGYNNKGQLGKAAGNTANSSIPIDVANITNADSVFAGSSHTCAKLQTGAVMCWGKNDSGQLGDESVEEKGAPVAVSSIVLVSQLSTGSDYTCAIDSGSAKCWGYNRDFQLGDGTYVNKNIPTQVILPSGTTVNSISSGSTHTCLIIGTDVMCWGSNEFGQLGGSDSGYQTTPGFVTK